MITRRQLLAAVPAGVAMAAISPGNAHLLRALAQGATPAGEDYHPVIDPATFATTIDNPYLPLIPGTTFHYDGMSGGTRQTNEVAVTSDTRQVMGVTCVVVRDRVYEGDTLLEDTADWFTQDAEGNVWYFGEDARSYEDGQVSTEGSWEAGVDGAQPGIVMEARPAVGDVYRQEYDPGEAEDMAKVTRLGEKVEVPYGTFDDVLVTHEWTPLEPDVVEEKAYAMGVGMVRSRSLRGEDERFELVDVTREAGTPAATASPVT